MLTTLSTFGPLLALAILNLLLTAWFLKYGARWARIPDITFRYALLTSFLQFLVQIAALVLLEFVCANVNPTVPVAIGQIAVLLFAGWLLLAGMFKTPLGRAIRAWLPTLIPWAVMLLFALFIYKPYIGEAFVTPSNSMSPTLRGPHLEVPCPSCDAPAVVGWREDMAMSPDRAITAICTSEFQSRQVKVGTRAWSTGDRFMVNKLLRPRRWDIIVFRFPQDPSVLHVQRLVGLPGEQVVIRDGAVWINGQKQLPPASCGKLTYTPAPPPFRSAPWASDAQPAQLGSDEYFVLGDFSDLASDSRLWPQGAPGHSPFAVPASHIEGIVTHIYWPIHRWRTLR